MELSPDYLVKCYWPHGCYLPIEEFDIDLVTGCMPIPKTTPVFVARSETRDFMVRHGFTNVRSIGLPIVYLPEQEIQRRRNTLIVMPMHTIDGDKDPDKRSAIAKYVEEIKSISDQFDAITIVIHQSCIRNGLWVEEFKSIGAKIVPGAYTSDKNSLHRIKSLLEQHEFMTTNEWGSHVAYGLAFGARVSIWGTAYKRTPQSYLVDFAWKSRPDLLKIFFSKEFQNDKEELLKRFAVPPKEGVEDRGWGEWLIGMDQKISPGEMAELLPIMIKSKNITIFPQQPLVASSQKEYLKKPYSSLIQNHAEIKKRKVLIFSDEPGVGGVGHYAHSILISLVRSGADVYSAQPEWNSPLIEEQREMGVRHIWTSYNPVHEFVRSFTDMQDARRIIDTARPDVILFADCCPISHVAAKNVAMENLIPFVITCNVEAPYLASRFSQVLPICEKHYSYASSVICVSKSVLKMLHEVFGLDAHLGEVIYYGRPEFFFSPKNLEARERLRAEISLPENAILCFTSARIVDEKGHIYQIEAARRLLQAGKLGPIYFAWAGTGSLTQKYRDLIKKEGLETKIHLLEYRWDVGDWLSAADIFLLPSRVEALPLCVIEAMAKGLPVAASAVAGVPEQMGNTGCLLPDPNKAPQATVAKLAEILSLWSGDAELRKQVGAAAKERASRLFREEDMCARTIQFLAKAAEESQKALAIWKMNSLCRSGEAKIFFEPYRKKLEEPVAMGEANDGELPVFPQDELEEIKNLLLSWQGDSSSAELEKTIKVVRRGVVDFLANTNDLTLGKLLGGSFGEVYRILRRSGISSTFLTAEENELSEKHEGGFNESGDFSLTRLATSMLFLPAHLAPAVLAIEVFPKWFRKDYWEYVFKSVEVFHNPGEAEAYCAHLQVWLREAVRRIEKEPGAELTRELAAVAMQMVNQIPVYCSPGSNRELTRLRSRVIEFTLGNSGLQLDMPAQLKGQRRAGQKIRVGVLNSHFGLQTETFVTLPAIHLDKDRFEVHLFCGTKNPGPVEDRCRSLAKGFHLLPESIQERVQMIRNAKLDVLIIGTNITAVTNEIALLAAFRLAPIQVVSHCSPMTSGFKNSDAFLSGSLAYREGLSEAEFSEKLILLDGPPVCLDYSCEPTASGLVPPARSQLGIPADAVVFFNAASCYKIPLELLHLWARLLKEARNSVLCLLPFNPNWASKLPETRFRELLESVLAEHGVDKKRVVLGPKLPNRAAVMNFERVADVYLDTLPFAGSISTVDPLQLGIPVVACDGETTRSRCSGAQLRELGLEELVGQNEEEYFAKALHLARDHEYRSTISSRIKQAMSKRPRFLNPEEYGRNLGNALEVLVEEGLGALENPKAFAQKVRERRSSSSGDSRSKNAEAEITISDAQTAFTEGRLSDAEDICREILGNDERCAGAWHLMGKMAALQGDLETAGEFASVACELDPQNADFVRESAEVFLRKKELEPAEKEVRRALEMAPESPEGLVLLGRILAEKDDKSASLEAFQDALRLRKDYAEGFSHYATALLKFGRGKDAISQIRKACALEPDSVEFQTNLAILLEQNARYVDALAAYGKAARMNPNVGFVWFRQGKLLNGLKRYAESIPALAKAISLPGQLGDYHYEYGLALHMSKRFQEALVHYEKALSMGYNTAALQCNRGVIYKDLRKGGDAIMAFHAAVKMDPSNVSYLNNLGAAALELGLNTEALECFEQAVEKNPKLPTARNNIGNLLKDRARGMDALPQYRKSMELNPDDRDAPSNYLLCHMYIPDMDPKLVFEEHKKWGVSTTKKFPPAFKFKPREAGAKIRVGFLSADLCHHPVAHFIEPIFRGYDRERFEFVAYGDQRKSDEFSARFAKQVDLWRETSSYDDRALAKLIHEDRVDILFELAGHTAYNRLGVFALKPAPVQVSYLGYPGTTGLPTIDFRITDAFADPQGATEHLHTEKLIRVPECAWCFEPDASAPEVEPLPALKNGFVTFGCFNNMAKLNPALFETWAEILLRVPGSHLRLKARTLTDDGVRKELKSYFTERGIEEDRLDFFGHTKKIADHLNHYHSVDIALDSFPYHGTTTTCEAMWMGCPVVTRAGKTHVSRVGVSLLSAVGLQEFITDTREDYIEKAVALAGQTERLEELRTGMRERLKNSVLMDEKRFVQGFEKALMEMATLGGLMRP
jgi:predicted O-linked N-acetylglucosamine transferase (SPINDLY family)